MDHVLGDQFNPFFTPFVTLIFVVPLTPFKGVVYASDTRESLARDSLVTIGEGRKA